MAKLKAGLMALKEMEAEKRKALERSMDDMIRQVNIKIIKFNRFIESRFLKPKNGEGDGRQK